MSLIEIVAIKGYIQTTYLAVYPDKLLLLDSGCRGDVTTILSYIKHTLNRPVEQLQTVVVSHMHPDHAGGAQRLKRKTGCQIVTSQKAQLWYQGWQGRKQHLTDLVLTYYVASRQGRTLTNQWYAPILKPDVLVKEGDCIPGFEDWVVIETPGHTNCDLSFLHRPSNQMYTGDLILKIKNKLVSPLVINFPKTYQDSLVKVREMHPDFVLLAHGGKVAIEDAQFARLIEKAPDTPRHMKLLAALNIKK